MSEVSARHRHGGMSLARIGRVPKELFATHPLQRFWAAVPLLVAALVVGLELDVPVVRPLLALGLLVGFPTLVLFRRAPLLTDSPAARLCYSFGASMLALIVVGFVVNFALPVVGVDHPLAPAALAVTWLVLDLALLAWRPGTPLVGSFPVVDVVRRALTARFELVQSLAVGAVLLAVVGAVRLNNDAGAGFALVGQALAAAALLALMVTREGSLWRDVRSLFLVATSLLLATSLRGWTITGHDIQAEFLAFRLTDGAQRWQMGALENAYNACLSVNILPTVLTQTTGLSGEVVFKVLLQLVFAVVPVLTFLYSRRFLSRRLALVATTFTLAFPTFFVDMPYLVRQEMAFFFLALVLLVATDRRTPWQRPMVALFGLGVVLSHYSTTYVMLMGLVTAVVAMVVLQAVRHRFRGQEGTARTAARSTFGLVLLNPVVIGFLVAASLLWAGPVTHTGGHASAVLKQTVAAITGNGQDGPGSSDTSYRLFAKDSTTPRDRLNSYVGKTMTYRNQKIAPQDLLIRHPGRAELRPEIVPAGRAPLTPVGKLLDSLGADPVHVNAAAKVACAGLLQVFLLLGLVWLLWRRRGAGDPPRPPREVAFLSVGAVAALGLIVLVPNLSVDYGVLRAFQQTLLVVAPLMAAGLWMVLRRLGSRAGTLVVAIPVVVLLILGGVLPALIGGQQQRLALASSGSYYDRFYTSDSETQAIDWLARTDAATQYHSKIIGNRNVMVKMLAATDNAAPIADRLYPTLLTRDAFVYVDRQILDEGRSTIFYTGDLINYVYPQQELARRLDLVYSSPKSRIYR
ncbi:DUF2206 domain-containing protein [Marmoricola sp. URHB0036]|uniref:DUF2206 domain-containing protein n=1 Tax=Marmoricola sp. URHB0036 TaxID=1298863 RepID=UPI00042795DE|nr:DUF2206 domain-containing protein [Marmoricola sp. URHB0036]